MLLYRLARSTTTCILARGCLYGVSWWLWFGVGGVASPLGRRFINLRRGRLENALLGFKDEAQRCETTPGCAPK